MDSNEDLEMENPIGFISHCGNEMRSTLLIDGYYEAAYLIRDHVKENHYDENTLIYPFLYLSRHFYELSLKFIADLMSNFHKNFKKENEKFDTKEYEKISKTHDLEEIYDFIKNNLYILDDRFKEIEEIINYLKNEIQFFYDDKKSDAFRYSKDIDGNENLPDIDFVDYDKILESLDNFRGATQNLYLYFDSINKEYDTKTIFKNFSRHQLKLIAKDLPKYNKWVKESFNDAKKEIKNKYNIESNKELSSILNIIKENKFLSFYIGYNRENYDEKYEIIEKIFKRVFDLCNLKEIANQNIPEREAYLEKINEIKEKEKDFVEKLTLDEKALILTYFRMGNEFKYSEDYENIFNEVKLYLEENDKNNYFITKIYEYSSIFNILHGIYSSGDYELFLKAYKCYKENCSVNFLFNNFEEMAKEIEETINK